MTRISIIIPIYNSEKYLEDCLLSVCEQTFTDFEAILVDDGSKDRSGEICDEFAKRDSRFRVIHKKNEGVSMARNTGLDEAKGEWVAFVDSDDKVKSDYLFSLNKLAINKTQIVVCDLRCREKKIVVSKEISNEDFVRHPALSAWGPWNKLFLLDIIKKNHIRFPVDITTMEDNIFVWSYLLHCTYLSISNKNYYDYKRRNGSLVRSVHRMEEIYRLCLAIVPIYNQLLIKFSLSQQIIRDYDRYLFVSCLKRLLISNCNGLPFKKVKQIIEKVLYEMETIVKRMSMQSNLTKVEKMMLEMMLHHCICIIALFSKLNSMMFNK